MALHETEAHRLARGEGLPTDEDVAVACTAHRLAIRAGFVDLVTQLSPENLTCDGELGAAEVGRKLRALKADWASLEGRYGARVTEDEAWGFGRA